jgi:hypothetical protein
MDVDRGSGDPALNCNPQTMTALQRGCSALEWSTMTQFDIGKPISIDHEELISGDVSKLLPRLCEAFGDEPDCLGIVLVDMKSVPEYNACRQTLLSYSSYLAALPSEQLTALENAHSKYVVGWSHGKEKLRSGAPDSRKGKSLLTYLGHESTNLWQAVTMSIQRTTQ